MQEIKNMLFRAYTYLRHQLTAWNTGGEGIHSPYLFYLVRMLLYDTNKYYCWQRIEKLRLRMLQSKQKLQVTDYGTGHNLPPERSVRQIAQGQLESRKTGQWLFRLVNHLSHVKGGGLQIVELGTSLGITTSYLALPDSRNRVWTFEGSRAIADVAQHNWQTLKVKNISLIEGNIDDTLNQTLDNNARAYGNEWHVDLAFLDANHTYEATMRYWQMLLPYRHGKSIFILDDIHYSPEMFRAWEEIKQSNEVTSTMDLWNMGLVFFDTNYWKRHYKLRY